MNEKSLVRLADGSKYVCEQPNENDNAIIEGRQRNGLVLSFIRPTKAELSPVEDAFSAEGATEELRVYYHYDEEAVAEAAGKAGKKAAEPLSDDQLEDVSHKDFQKYTMMEAFDKKRVVVQKGDADNLPVYGWQLTIELGQRHPDE